MRLAGSGFPNVNDALDIHSLSVFVCLPSDNIDELLNSFVVPNIGTWVVFDDFCKCETSSNVIMHFIKIRTVTLFDVLPVIKPLFVLLATLDGVLD